MPSPLTASAACMGRPSVPWERLFLPIGPHPAPPGCSAKLRSAPSWMRSIASAAPACVEACAAGAVPRCSPASSASPAAGRSGGSSQQPPSRIAPPPGTTTSDARPAPARSAPVARSSVHRPAARAAKRPRPAISPTGTRLEAARQVPACWALSTQVATSSAQLPVARLPG